jgi:hypothetical protein
MTSCSEEPDAEKEAGQKEEESLISLDERQACGRRAEKGSSLHNMLAGLPGLSQKVVYDRKYVVESVSGEGSLMKRARCTSKGKKQHLPDLLPSLVDSS